MAHASTKSHVLAVGERGRVVIPAEIRRALGIVPGSALIARVEDGERLVLEDRRALARRLRGAWKNLAAGRDLVGELIEERSAEAALEEAKSSGEGLRVIERGTTARRTSETRGQ